MIPSSACQPWHADHPGPAGERGHQSRQLHHSTGHDTLERSAVSRTEICGGPAEQVRAEFSRLSVESEAGCGLQLSGSGLGVARGFSETQGLEASDRGNCASSWHQRSREPRTIQLAYSSNLKRGPQDALEMGSVPTFRFPPRDRTRRPRKVDQGIWGHQCLRRCQRLFGEAKVAAPGRRLLRKCAIYFLLEIR